jgi:hypothetical protein
MRINAHEVSTVHCTVAGGSVSAAGLRTASIDRAVIGTNGARQLTGKVKLTRCVGGFTNGFPAIFTMQFTALMGRNEGGPLSFSEQLTRRCSAACVALDMLIKPSPSNFR